MEKALKDIRNLAGKLERMPGGDCTLLAIILASVAAAVEKNQLEALMHAVRFVDAVTATSGGGGA